MRRNHKLEYRIYGEELQIVEIEQAPYEAIVAGSGSFIIDRKGQMQVVSEDGSAVNQSVLGKVICQQERVLCVKTTNRKLILKHVIAGSRCAGKHHQYSFF
jgi:uncharacterized protein (AIM24 family)